MRVTAIIAAGGRGERFGAGIHKQLLPVGGRPMLERSVAAFVTHPAVAEVIVALPRELMAEPPAYLRSAEAFALREGEAVALRKGEAVARREGEAVALRVVDGGARRQDSVANAFRAADAGSELIVIHDAARPFASADLITRTIAAAAESGAALAAVVSRDTVKRAGPAEGGGPPEGGHDVRRVVETLPRETIYLAQTPQAFRRDVLAAALALAERDGLDATDEAALAERAGHVVRLVDGEATNIKITTPEDMTIANAIANRESRMTRVGTGYDLHRLVAGRPLILGGVTIPSGVGALGHSDADVVCHAVTDAVLGAACLGDIGRHFPDSDPRWKGASSIDLLQRAVALVREQGFAVRNVDVTIILEAPKIRGHVDAMRAAVAAALGVEPCAVSIKGKTNEGVDATGRGEAIAAHAVALLS